MNKDAKMQESETNQENMCSQKILDNPLEGNQKLYFIKTSLSLYSITNPNQYAKALGDALNDTPPWFSLIGRDRGSIKKSIMEAIDDLFDAHEKHQENIKDAKND